MKHILPRHHLDTLQMRIKLIKQDHFLTGLRLQHEKIQGLIAELQNQATMTEHDRRLYDQTTREIEQDLKLLRKMIAASGKDRKTAIQNTRGK